MDILLRGGFGIRRGELQGVGASTITHKHTFDHITHLQHAGRVEMLDDEGNVVRFKDCPAGGFAFIAKGAMHRIVCTGERLLYECLYIHRNPDGEIVDEYDGWMPGYE
jgi:hypothetical protein